jgi:hypothetical protein
MGSNINVTDAKTAAIPLASINLIIIYFLKIYENGSKNKRFYEQALYILQQKA